MWYNVTFEALGISYGMIGADSGEQDGIMSHVAGWETKYSNLIIVSTDIGTAYFEVFSRAGANIFISS